MTLQSEIQAMTTLELCREIDTLYGLLVEKEDRQEVTDQVECAYDATFHTYQALCQELYRRNAEC